MFNHYNYFQNFETIRSILFWWSDNYDFET